MNEEITDSATVAARGGGKALVCPVLFVASALVITIALFARFWPIERDHLIRVVGSDGKFGFINLDGRVVVEPRWDDVQPFDQEGMANVLRGAHEGYINRMDEVVIPARWNVIASFDEHGMAPVTTDEQGARKVGWIDRSGAVVIEPRFEDIGDFDEQGMAWVMEREGKEGWIDRKGREVVPLEWKSTERSFDDQGMLVVQSWSGAGWVNRKGKPLDEPRWEAVWNFDEKGMAAVSEGDRWGWVNLEGETVIVPQWQEVVRDWPVGFFQRPREREAEGIPEPHLIHDDDFSEFGRFNRSNYHDIDEFDASLAGSLSGVYPVFEDRELGVDAIPSPALFDAGDMALVKDGEMYGWIDRSGKVVIPLQWYDAALFDDHGLAQVRRGGRWGWIDRAGEVVIPLEYFATEPFDGAGMAAVRLGGKWGWINLQGESVIRNLYTEVGKFGSNGLAKVKPQFDWGWIDRQGKMVVKAEWDCVGEFDREGMAMVCRNGRVGWVNSEGEVVVPAAWPMASEFDAHDMAMVRDDAGRFGWIDRAGKVVIPAEYVEVEPFGADGLACVVNDDAAAGLLDRSGRVAFFPSSPDTWMPHGGLDSNGLVYAAPINGLFKESEDYQSAADPFSSGRTSLEREEDAGPSPGAWFDRDGNKVLGLPGEGWEWASTRAIPATRNTPEYHYVAWNKSHTPGWSRKLYLKLARWVSGDESPIPGNEIACIAYNKNGKVIWDSRWVRFEVKCWLVIGVGVAVLVLAGVRMRRGLT